MITKEDFCRYYIKKYCEENKISEEDLVKNINYYITKSSCLGIALSYIYSEKFSKENVDYISTRGGIFITSPLGNILSFREMLGLLPFVVEKEEDLNREESQ